MRNECLIFVHKGESWYLYYTVKQASYHNPHSRIIVISDRPQRKLLPYAEVHNIAHYWGGARAMEDIYRHNSPFSREREIINFQRWFVVRDFMRRNSVPRAVYVDSDVLVCDGLFPDFHRLNEARLGIVGYQGSHTMLIPDESVVADFCDFIEHLYREESPSLTAQYDAWRKVNANVSVSDMHALHTFIARKGLKTLDLSRIYKGAMYDTIVRQSDGLKLRDGVKDVRWVDGHASVELVNSSNRIRMKTIHCQGMTKGRILEFFSARDFGYYRDRGASKMGSIATKMGLVPV